MKRIAILLTLMFAVSWSELAGAEKPNIIFVLLDDLGKEWISCYGAAGIETPNVDKLAATGMRFNNAYSMPQCTPSRTCFFTGQYPFRNGWVNHWDVPRWGVGYFDWTKNPSIGRVMKAAGYKTAAAGKWQINDFRIQPDAMVKHGFDEYCMWTGGEGDPSNKKHENISTQRYWDPYIHTTEGSKTHKGQFGPDIYNQFLLDFITEKYDMHKAMVRYADFLTGKLMDHLDKLGIRENTIIVWTCDNGTSGGINNEMNGRLVKGGKTLTTENGVNTPFIVNCPGTVPAGVVSDALVDFTDMMPTFADFAGGTLQPSFVYDGFSAKQLFLGKAQQSRRTWNLAMGSQGGVSTDKGIENVYYFRDRVIREERYKLFVGIDRKPEKLVDVINDPEEEKNLMDNPELAPVLALLYQPVATMPLEDNDPIYAHDPDYPDYKKDGLKSQIHKIGHPDNPDEGQKKTKKKEKKK